MIRRLGKFLALITVLAATLSAQCAAACTLEPAAPSTMADHSCCKHRSNSPAPCTSASVHSNDASLDVHRASVPVPLMAPQSEWRVAFALPTRRSETESVDTSPGPQPLITAANLRV